jgi:hypothetical protein
MPLASSNTQHPRLDFGGGGALEPVSWAIRDDVMRHQPLLRAILECGQAHRRNSVMRYPIREYQHDPPSTQLLGTPLTSDPHLSHSETIVNTS